MSNVYKHCQKHHGYRAKSKDVRIDFEKLEIIRQKLNYNYFGKTAESVKNKEKNWRYNESSLMSSRLILSADDCDYISNVPFTNNY